METVETGLDPPLGYEELLSTLQLSSLTNRRLFLKLCTIFKVLHGLCYFPQNVFSARETRSHVCRPLMLTHPFARTNSYFYSFVPHSILQWNNLPEHVVSSSSMHSFKESLMHYLNHTYN